jgi:YidC/Oxa1 family membrane protein insertase
MIKYLEEEENRKAFIEKYNSATHYLNDGTPVKVGDGLTLTAEEILENLPDLELFDGFNLGVTPELSHFKAEKIGEKLILIVPVLTLIAAYVGNALTRKFTYQPEVAPEVQSQNRIMNIFMPLFSFYIAFQVPVAVGIYWVVQNVLSPVQQIALARLFPIPEITPEQMKEAERLYGGKVKKKKGTALTKKKKSLVYDDDEEYESVSSVTPKKVLKEKQDSETNTPIDKAPLKEDDK